ncbi:histidinol-phosphate transaminase [Micromonospora sp. NPDC000442]|uniref:histidinol-phosphate transaminase n=1 Tax=Micromonospora sp. NPDC000442 TaxID=3364217 RepID=UPI0036CF886A
MREATGPTAGAPRGVTRPLSRNESSHRPLPDITATVAASSRDVHRYPDPACADLTLALAHRHGVELDRVAVGAGSCALLQAVFLLAGPGATAVYAWRSFEYYPILAGHLGIHSERVPLTDDVHDLTAMADRITATTRLVVICNPNNPTGTLLGPDRLRAFLDRVPPTCLVALDEAYFEYVDEPVGTGGLALCDTYPNLVVLRTFSKAYGLAGLRVGYLIGAARIVASLREMTLPYAVSGPAQHAAVAALNLEDVLLTRVRETIAERTRVRAALLADGFAVPASQANFLWLGLGENAGPFGRWCARAGIELRVFDGEGVRVSIGSPADNDAFLAAGHQWRVRNAPELLTTGALR